MLSYSRHSNAFLVLPHPRPPTPANLLSFVWCVYRSETHRDKERDQRLRRSNSERGNNGCPLPWIRFRPATRLTSRFDRGAAHYFFVFLQRLATGGMMRDQTGPMRAAAETWARSGEAKGSCHVVFCSLLYSFLLLDLLLF